MGVTVRQKLKGKGNPWWIFICHNGERTSRKIGSKEAAEKVAREIEAKITLGQFGFEEKQSPTFEQCYQKFLNGYSQLTHKESTQRSYRAIVEKHILPVFGETRLDQISRAKVKDFLGHKREKGLSLGTVRIIKAYLGSILEQAVDDEIIDKNPVNRLGKKMLGGNRDKEEPEALTQEELKQLLDATFVDFPDDYPLFLLLGRTGMRIGEALALRWEDIDFEKRSITVKRNIVRGQVSKPKSGKSRQVDMSRQLKEALKGHKKKSKKKGLSLGLGDLPKYVFTNERGGFIDLDNWRRRVFNRALKKAGVKRIRIHDLRHTYATLRVSKGDNIRDVSGQLGHSSVKVTLDIYARWLPGKKKDEVDALDDPEYTLMSRQGIDKEC